MENAKILISNIYYDCLSALEERTEIKTSEICDALCQIVKEKYPGEEEAPDLLMKVMFILLSLEENDADK